MFKSLKKIVFFVWLIANGLFAFGNASPVVVIHGETSLSDTKERTFALPLARHAVKWYCDGGIKADLASDTDLESVLAGRKVAHFVHCEYLNSAQIAAVRSFVQGGGKIIVTFSSSIPLAKIMGVELGQYKSDCAFHSMLFESERPPNVPPSIRQSSPNIVIAYPVEGKSRTLAWWCNAEGRRTGYPAWIMSDTGYWMSHVLLGDGDTRAKGHLLVALAASLAPELWKEAAESRIATCEAVGRWSSLDDAVRQTSVLKDSPRVLRLRQLLDQAEQTRRTAYERIKDGRYAVAWMIADDLEQEMQDAYGMLQSPQSGEIRAVWDQSGLGLYPEDWPRTCRVLKESGITDILVKVAGPGFARCAIDAFPRSHTFDPADDQLSACISAAKPFGLRVHAWIVCLDMDQATTNRVETYSRKGWLLQGTDGSVKPWLDPSLPAVRSQVAKAAEELFTRYDIAGVHLDFIRYPDDYYGSLGDGTRIRFEADRGEIVESWPKAVRRGPLFTELVRWRARQVTSLVAEIRTVQRRVAPGKTVSAAVYGQYPTCIESVGQDWKMWLECGYVDYVYPMNYTESADRFANLLKAQLANKTISQRVVGGIGVTAAGCRLDVGGVIDQIDALREGGAAGFALFDLDAHLADDVLPVLKLGATGGVE